MKVTLRELKYIINQAMNESFEGKEGKWSYSIEDDMGLSGNISADQARDIKVRVVSGPSAVGTSFRLGDIAEKEGEEAYSAHPLVIQIINHLNNLKTSTSAKATFDMENTDKGLTAGREIRVLFVGDSQTYYPGVSYADIILKTPGITGKKIARNGAGLRTINKFLKKGLAGDDYDIVSIMGGGNNSSSSSPPYSVYDEMYNYAKQSGAKVVALTNPTKTNKKNQTSRYPSNELLADYVRNNDKPDVILDVNSAFSDPKYFKADNVHINKLAHQQLAAGWITAIKEKFGVI